MKLKLKTVKTIKKNKQVREQKFNEDKLPESPWKVATSYSFVQALH